MKNPERVAQLLAELRELTETPIELAVVNRCEKDLTAPPTAEIIDDEHQCFNGIVFNRVKSGHYHLTTTIHRVIWAYFFGEIPEGCHIHHIDGNPANNCIDNLQLLTREKHMHTHSFHEKTTTYVCEYCGKTYTSKVSGRHRFCSDKCQSAYYYRHYTEERVCPFCGKTFVAHKWHKVKYCSSICAGKAHHQKCCNKKD